MPANMTSVRLQILQAIETFFTNMTATDPTDDPFGITWSTVEIGPLAKPDQRKRCSLGIVPGLEKEWFEMPFINSKMIVNIEFRVTVNAGDPAPGVMIEQALTVVKRGMTIDRSWGGLAIDTKVVNSEVDLITYADRSAVGVCVAEIQFRYGFADPRTQQGAYGAY